MVRFGDAHKCLTHRGPSHEDHEHRRADRAGSVSVIGNNHSRGGRGAAAKPNVVIILTDDQGFGELGATGNPVIHTPHIDRLAAQGVSLTNFHVMPVCSPTRACLMTGRYNYRTGITDTFLGRSMMHPDETTLAEMLVAGGVSHGHFRQMAHGRQLPDAGHGQGLSGIAGPHRRRPRAAGRPARSGRRARAYFNATLRHNGKWMKLRGYVSNVITNATIEFIQKKSDQPFFLYLPFNCPHSPHQVPDEYRQHHPDSDFEAAKYPHAGHPMAAKHDPEDLARVYGMIENIDDNVGRLLAKLDELHLANNTIVVFFSDNGCQQHNGFNAGFQGWKGTTYKGGVHQFCFVRWPSQLEAGRRVDRIAAHIDIAPTMLELCGVAKPEHEKFDGRSLAPLLRGQQVARPDRTLFFQWHRGNAPERYRAFAAQSQDWKLVQSLVAGEQWNGKTAFQLYDITHDPLELHDLAAQEPDRVAKLKAQYDTWFNDVTGTRDYAKPSRIFLGANQENPVLLTRQDWRGSGASWSPNGIGHWEVNVVAATKYEIKLWFAPLKTNGEAMFSCGGVTARQLIKAGEAGCAFRNVPLPLGPSRLESSVKEGHAIVGLQYVEVKYLGC